MTAIASGESNTVGQSAAGGSATETLAARVARLRSRGAQGDWDRLLLIAGGLLLPLGILLVILGWVGASHTVLLFEQIPYLISGGQLGLALVFAGGFVYFAYWLTLIVRESRSRHDEMIAALERVEAAFLGQSSTARDVTRLVPVSQDGNSSKAGAVPTSAAAPGAVASGELVATRKGSMVHRSDCQVVAGRSDVRKVSPEGEDLVPCKICQPFSSPVG